MRPDPGPRRARIRRDLPHPQAGRPGPRAASLGVEDRILLAALVLTALLLVASESLWEALSSLY